MQLSPYALTEYTPIWCSDQLLTKKENQGIQTEIVSNDQKPALS